MRPVRNNSILYTGIPVAAFAAVLVGTALTAFGLELAAINSALALAINVVVVGGAAPTILRWRHKPTVRWLVHGAVAGAVVSFVALGISVATSA
ncbi:DUF2537 domain-containing protein [Rhodococcus sp. Eu-32]|nr:DUF2537 domain-containing protein [Rhodococcus sp. Eu-32]